MKERTSWRSIGLSLVFGLIFWLYPLGIDPAMQSVLGIMAFAGAMWFTEAVPLHVTALAVPLMLVVLAGFSPADATQPFFDPVVVLLLGGFVLAVAMQKHALDKKIAFFFINKFGHTPGRFLLGLMAVTAFLSFWMTNTASTALIIPIAIVVLKANNIEPLTSKYGKSVVLGVAYAATIGGMGTLIGSTPNAIAAKFLADQGIALSFTDWMAFGLPMVIILLPICWLLLTKFFPPPQKELKIKKQSTKLSKQQKLTLGVFAFTALLWLTTSIHGVSSSMVSIVPILLLYLLGLLATEDFAKAHWPTLILFGGGLALGTAITMVGLDQLLASLVVAVLNGNPTFIVFAGVAAASIALTIFASNTAAAAIIVPVAIPLAIGLGLPLRLLTIVAALGVSLDFIVPVGTPPSAIAYSTGYIKVKDMAFAGTVLAVISVAVLSTLATLFWL
ncbi:SLC13 family permease [archaeon]